MRWKWIAPIFILALVIAAIGAYATYQSRYIFQQEQRAEYVGLQQSVSGLAALDAAGAKAVTIALSDTFFNTFASALSGKAVQFTISSLPNETLTLNVVSVSLRPTPGALKAEFNAQLSSDKRGYSVGLLVGAVAYFAGIDRVVGDPSQPELFSANLKFIPLDVQPRLSYGPFNLGGRRLVSNIIDGNLI